MVQTANSIEASSLPNTQPGPDMFLRPIIPRKGTQRHCDHLEKLKPVQCDPRERRIECYDVAAFLEAAESAKLHGFWEVDRQSSEELTWTPIICCDTFELLVQCPPGKRITLGNLDLSVILETCLKDADGDVFIRNLTSTSKCWATDFVDFRWLLRGTLAGKGPALKSKMSVVQRRKSVKQLLSPTKLLQLAQSPDTRRTGTTQQTSPPFARDPASPTTPSQLKRWKSSKQRSPPIGGICASQTAASPGDRRNSSFKERASSLLQMKRQSNVSTCSVSTSSSCYSQ